jgi:hypothetical protein
MPSRESEDGDFRDICYLMGLALVTWQSIEDVHFKIFLKIVRVPIDDVSSVPYFAVESLLPVTLWSTRWHSILSPRVPSKKQSKDGENFTCPSRARTRIETSSREGRRRTAAADQGQGSTTSAWGGGLAGRRTQGEHRMSGEKKYYLTKLPAYTGAHLWPLASRHDAFASRHTGSRKKSSVSKMRLAGRALVCLFSLFVFSMTPRLSRECRQLVIHLPLLYAPGLNCGSSFHPPLE